MVGTQFQSQWVLVVILNPDLTVYAVLFFYPFCSSEKSLDNGFHDGSSATPWPLLIYVLNIFKAFTMTGVSFDRFGIVFLIFDMHNLYHLMCIKN